MQILRIENFSCYHDCIDDSSNFSGIMLNSLAKLNRPRIPQVSVSEIPLNIPSLQRNTWRKELRLLQLFIIFNIFLIIDFLIDLDRLAPLTM